VSRSGRAVVVFDVLALTGRARLSARLTAAKATSERAWLGAASAVVLQQAPWSRTRSVPAYRSGGYSRGSYTVSRSRSVISVDAPVRARRCRDAFLAA